MDDVSSLHSILPADVAVPEWVHLIPGGTFSGRDGRGPYHLDDAVGVIAASMAADRRLVFDQDHATDHSLKTGIPAPARGWITQMQARDDGIWAQVEWTPEGRRLLENREYRGISPVFSHDRASSRVTRVLRASLTNAPNLDLTALHSRNKEHDMDFLPAIRTALALPETADEAAIVAAATAARTAVAAHSAQRGTLEEVTALQTQILELQTAQRRGAAETVIAAAMHAGKPILASRREEFIARHMQDPKGTEAWLADMPTLMAGGVPGGPAPVAADGIDHADAQVIALMGLSPDAFRKAKEAQSKGVAA